MPQRMLGRNIVFPENTARNGAVCMDKTKNGAAGRTVIAARLPADLIGAVWLGRLAESTTRL